MIAAIIILLTLFSLSGLPIFAGIMGAAMLGLHTSGVDFSAIAIEVFRLANAPVLLAIPLFTFAGYLLSEGHTSTRLVRFSRSLFGWLPGGLGVVALVSCSFFTAITGATGVTIIALGGLLFPALISEKYREDFSLGLVTSSGSLGLLFPPSLPIILYGFVSGVSIEKLFVAGLLPGILIVGSLCLFSIFMGRKWKLETPPFSVSEFLHALKEAAWELPIPVPDPCRSLFGLLHSHGSRRPDRGLCAYSQDDRVQGASPAQRCAQDHAGEHEDGGGHHDRARSRPGFHQLSGGCLCSHEALRIHEGNDREQDRFPPCSEPFPAARRLHDGYLQRHSRGGASDHSPCGKIPGGSRYTSG